MIPFALLGGILKDTQSGKETEIRILDISADSLTFRLSVRHKLPDRFVLRLNFHLSGQTEPESVILKSFTAEVEEENIWFREYRLITGQEDFYRASRSFMKDYSSLVKLKLEEDDSRVSEKLSGYPADREEQYPECFADARRKWFGLLNREFNAEDCYIAVSLDNHEKWEGYLSQPGESFFRKLWRDAFTEEHPIISSKVSCIYIGSQYCPLLFPDSKVLLSLLDKAVREGLEPVVVFSWMSEGRIRNTEEYLEILDNWCRCNQTELELVINDYGMLEMLRKSGYSYFRITLGILPVRHRKDPRLPYMAECGESDMSAVSALSASFYREYLKEHFCVKRFSMETCGCEPEMINEPVTMHFPFYQTNTAQFCTLYAACRYNDRGHQHKTDECPRYCRNRAFLYGEANPAAGRYNSLFGFDERALDKERIGVYSGRKDFRIVAERL